MRTGIPRKRDLSEFFGRAPLSEWFGHDQVLTCQFFSLTRGWEVKMFEGENKGRAARGSGSPLTERKVDFSSQPTIHTFVIYLLGMTSTRVNVVILICRYLYSDFVLVWVMPEQCIHSVVSLLTGSVQKWQALVPVLYLVQLWAATTWARLWHRLCAIGAVTFNVPFRSRR